MRGLYILFAGLVLLAMVPAPPVQAQQRAERLVRAHQYSDAIRSLRRGGTGGLSEQEWGVLGVAHLRRGYLLRDLAAFQSQLGALYYHKRATSRDVTRSPWTSYFLGRYLVEQAECKEARGAFQKALKEPTLAGSYHERARIWTAVCDALEGKEAAAKSSWDAVTVGEDAVVAGELAYARWSATGEMPVVRCGSRGGATTAASRCRLLFGIQSVRIDELYALQQRLLRSGAPDQEQLIGGNYTLRFYDPATLDLLARADFVAAMDAFSRVSGPQPKFFAGVSAYEAGLKVRARGFLRASGQPLAPVYLGALDYLSGNTETAERQWQHARQGEAEAEALWARVASRFPALRDQVRSAAKGLRRNAAGNPGLAHELGRALLAAGDAGTALAVMESAYPTEYNNQLDRIEPGYVATLAHARFMAGRAYYPAVRAHLAALATAYPISLGVLDLAQSYTAPELTTGKKRTD